MENRRGRGEGGGGDGKSESESESERVCEFVVVNVQPLEDA